MTRTLNAWFSTALVAAALVLVNGGFAAAIEFVPLGVGAWETSGEYNLTYNGDGSEYKSSLVYPLGETPEIPPFYYYDDGVAYLPDSLTPASPTTVWDSGLSTAFVSDDGLIVAGSGSVNCSMGWINFDPDVDASYRYFLHNSSRANYFGGLIGLSADGQTGAVVLQGAVSSYVKVGLNTKAGYPDYVLPDSDYVRLRAISGDGEVLVGLTSYGYAYRWSEAEGGVQIVDGLWDVADLSFDGAVIVGGSQWWNEADGAEYFGPEPSDDFDYMAEAVSSDGAVIAGTATIDGVRQAFRWTEAGGFQMLGDLPGGDDDSYATDMSSDGTTIIGMTSTDRGYEPFRWNAATGMQSVVDLLVDGGADLGDYQLVRPNSSFPTITGLSGDGTTLVGSAPRTSINSGYYPGYDHAWLARIAIVPEPATAALAVIAFVLQRPRRREAASRIGAVTA